jgi:hypothetical protein
MEERAIMWFSKVIFSLASLDVFKPDFLLKNKCEGWWMAISSSHQIAYGTSALSRPVIDERILAM